MENVSASVSEVFSDKGGTFNPTFSLNLLSSAIWRGTVGIGADVTPTKITIVYSAKVPISFPLYGYTKTLSISISISYTPEKMQPPQAPPEIQYQFDPNAIGNARFNAISQQFLFLFNAFTMLAATLMVGSLIFMLALA